jgi:hypothetical protein
VSVLSCKSTLGSNTSQRPGLQVQIKDVGTARTETHSSNVFLGDRPSLDSFRWWMFVCLFPVVVVDGCVRNAAHHKPTPHFRELLHSLLVYYYYYKFGFSRETFYWLC